MAEKKILMKQWVIVCAIVIAACVRPIGASAALTEFYVDPDFGGSGSGTPSAPWQYLTSAAWNAINGALAGSDATVYFSARDASADTNQITYKGVALSRMDSSAHRLTLDGMSKYNTSDASPSWASYSGASKYEVRYGYAISTPTQNENYVTIRGFKAIGGYGAYGGQALNYWGGDHVIIEQNELTHDPGAIHGATLQFGYAHTAGGGGNGGNTDITIRNNLVHDTFGEGIYVGGSEDTKLSAHSNVLIEKNTIYNAGVRGGQGDCIDIKDELTNVTVRNNVCHDSFNSSNTNGITSLSTTDIENNVIYNMPNKGIVNSTFWGRGLAGSIIRNNIIENTVRESIYIDDGANKPNSNTLIEKNTVAQSGGISIGSNANSITGLTIRNNLFDFSNGSKISGWGTIGYSITSNDFYGASPYAGPFGNDSALPGVNINANPQFVNINNPAGADGQWFTADDGLAPKAQAVCIGGQNGGVMGALPCAAGTSPQSPPPSPTPPPPSPTTPPPPPPAPPQSSPSPSPTPMSPSTPPPDTSSPEFLALQALQRSPPPLPPPPPRPAPIPLPSPTPQGNGGAPASPPTSPALRAQTPPPPSPHIPIPHLTFFSRFLAFLERLASLFDFFRVRGNVR